MLCLRRRAFLNRAMLARKKRLDALGCADERHHDEDAEGEQHRLKDVGASVVEAEQDRERPAAGKRRAEHLGADQDRGGQDGDDTGPDDLAGRVLGLQAHVQSIRFWVAQSLRKGPRYQA